MSSSVPLEALANLRINHQVTPQGLMVFVDGFNVESTKTVSSIGFWKEGQIFYLQVRSRLVTPADRLWQSRQPDMTELRRRWGSDLRRKVAFAREFIFKDLSTGRYEVRYDAAKDGTKPVIYSFLVE